MESRYQEVQINVKNRLNTTSTNWRFSYGVPQGSIPWPLLFLTYINHLPLILDRYSFPILFADDTSVIIADTNSTNFLSNSTVIFSQLNKWFSVNLLLLHYYKTNFLHCRTKNSLILNTKLSYNNESIHTKSDTKFLGIIMDRSYNGELT